MIRSVGILGYGEIGRAVASLFPKSFPVRVRDLDRDELDKSVVALHVCIPYGNRFFESVRAAMEDSLPMMVIVHSTVPVGTTERIGLHAVHSPVRGMHPDLGKSLRVFPKYVGINNYEAGEQAVAHLAAVGVPTVVVDGTRTTELLKLLDTTYYATCIAFHGWAKELCERTGADFDVAMTHANRTYNSGYRELGLPEVARPVLRPPNPKIGGHCLIPNAEMLAEQFGESGFLREVLRYR